MSKPFAIWRLTQRETVGEGCGGEEQVQHVVYNGAYAFRLGKRSKTKLEFAASFFFFIQLDFNTSLPPQTSFLLLQVVRYLVWWFRQQGIERISAKGVPCPFSVTLDSFSSWCHVIIYHRNEVILHHKVKSGIAR